MNDTAKSDELTREELLLKSWDYIPRLVADLRASVDTQYGLEDFALAEVQLEYLHSQFTRFLNSMLQIRRDLMPYAKDSLFKPLYTVVTNVFEVACINEDIEKRRDFSEFLSMHENLTRILRAIHANRGESDEVTLDDKFMTKDELLAGKVDLPAVVRYLCRLDVESDTDFTLSTTIPYRIQSVIDSCANELIKVVSRIRCCIEDDHGVVPMSQAGISLEISSKEFPNFSYCKTYRIWRFLLDERLPVTTSDIVGTLDMSSTTVGKARKELNDRGMINDFGNGIILKEEWRIKTENLDAQWLAD